MLSVFLFIGTEGLSQELNCRVVINSDQVQTSDRRIFDEMQIEFANFLNNQKWTNDQFELEERIKCNLIITLQNPSSIGNYQATVQIQSARPVYNSNYYSPLINRLDKAFNFRHQLSAPLVKTTSHIF